MHEDDSEPEEDVEVNIRSDVLHPGPQSDETDRFGLCKNKLSVQVRCSSSPTQVETAVVPVTRSAGDVAAGDGESEENAGDGPPDGAPALGEVGLADVDVPLGRQACRGAT